MSASIRKQSDCLATDGCDTVVCVGDSGDEVGSDGLCVTVHSLIYGTTECKLVGHAERVVSVAIDTDGDGDLIASGSIDGEIRLWSRERSECVATLEGCHCTVFALALRDDLLVSGEASPEGNPAKYAKARLWSIGDVDACSLIATFSEHRGNIWGAALGNHPKAMVALTACRDGTAKVWPTRAAAAPGGTLRNSLATLKHPKLVCSVSVEGFLAVTGCLDTRVRLWTLDASRPTAYSCTHSFSHDQGGVPAGLPPEAEPPNPFMAAGAGSRGGPWISCRLLEGSEALVTGGGEANTVRIWALGAPGPNGTIGSVEWLASLDHGQAVRGVACVPHLGAIVSVGGLEQPESNLVVWWPSPVDLRNQGTAPGTSTPAAADEALSAPPATGDVVVSAAPEAAPSAAPAEQRTTTVRGRLMRRKSAMF